MPTAVPRVTDPTALARMARFSRRTSEPELNTWNQQFRQSPIYQTFMQSRGLPTNGNVRLSRSQQEDLERELARNGIRVPEGMHIDQGGNLNQRNRLVRNVAIGAGIAAGGYFAAPYIAGAMAGGGAGGAGAAGAAGAGGTAGIGTGAGLTAGALPGTLGAIPGSATGLLAGGAGAAGAAGAAGTLATTGWAPPLAAYPAAATSALGAGGAGTAAAAGGGILSALRRAGPALGMAGDIGSVIGGAAEGAAGERGEENDFTGRTNQARAGMYGTQQGSILRALEAADAGRMDRARLGLDRARFATVDAPTARGRQSVVGSAMANAQDVQFGGLPSRIRVPTVSGGLRPSMFSGETRALGRELMANALRGQRAGDRFADVPETDYHAGLIPPPEMTGYRGPGGLEQAGGAAGTIGGILSLLARYGNRGGARP